MEPGSLAIAAKEPGSSEFGQITPIDSKPNGMPRQ